MINTSSIFKELNDYDKKLVNTVLEWAIKNCHLYSSGKSDEARTRSETTLAKFKFEAKNFSFERDELLALNSAISYFHTELITYKIGSYDEETIDKMHASLKELGRKLEDFVFDDY